MVALSAHKLPLPRTMPIQTIHSTTHMTQPTHISSSIIGKYRTQINTIILRQLKPTPKCPRQRCGLQLQCSRPLLHWCIPNHVAKNGMHSYSIVLVRHEQQYWKWRSFLLEVEISSNFQSSSSPSYNRQRLVELRAFSSSFHRYRKALHTITQMRHKWYFNAKNPFYTTLYYQNSTFQL